MNDNLLTISGIKKSFKLDKNTFRNVLNGIDFNLYEGEIMTIMGPSGGGKSTFLKILAGIIKPDEGRIIFKGVSIQENRDYYTSHIGFIFQEYKLIPHLNAFENVALALRLRGVEDWKERANEALNFMGISHLAESYPNRLSGGESQRVGIARAVVIRPSIIFADEPTGNLDKKTGQDIINLFQTIKNTFKTSFVIVTHDKDLEQYADKKRYLTKGLLLENNPDEN